MFGKRRGTPFLLNGGPPKGTPDRVSVEIRSFGPPPSAPPPAPPPKPPSRFAATEATLLPCPIDGKPARIGYRPGSWGYYPGKVWVECVHCGLATRSYYDEPNGEDALLRVSALWNVRIAL